LSFGMETLESQEMVKTKKLYLILAFKTLGTIFTWCLGQTS
jgi:hypothetical protein